MWPDDGQRVPGSPSGDSQTSQVYFMPGSVAEYRQQDQLAAGAAVLEGHTDLNDPPACLDPLEPFFG